MKKKAMPTAVRELLKYTATNKLTAINTRNKGHDRINDKNKTDVDNCPNSPREYTDPIIAKAVKESSKKV